MEISKAESQKIRNLTEEWFSHPEQELEATFENGNVNIATFLQIAQRLQSKGYKPLPLEDRLSILLPENIRILLTGSSAIQNYCRENDITGKPYVAMIKDSSIVESKLDLDEYNTRIKIRRELPLSPDVPILQDKLSKWGSIPKAFRLIRRWTFEKKGVKFDLSMVRGTTKDRRGDYKKVRTFQEENIFRSPATYEIEVELVRSEITSVDEAIVILIQGIGEILRGIQKNTNLIRKSVAEKVLRAYADLTGTDRFRGVAPITLERENMLSEMDDTVPNIRRGYNVTDKADGLRVLGFCNKEGELFLIDMAMNVYKTGLTNALCAQSLLDCEWIIRNRANQAVNMLMAFDIYYAPGKNKVDARPFISTTQQGEMRHDYLTEWMKLWNSGDGPKMGAGITPTSKMIVGKKTFIAAAATTPLGIFAAAAKILDNEQPYYTDGLIFTPNDKPLPSRPGDTFKEQFKWKPAEDNTIDFLVNFEKDEQYITQDKITVSMNEETNTTVRFKTMRLYVGSSQDSIDPRAEILYKNVDPRTIKVGVDTYKPVLFNPIANPDTMANICYCNVEEDAVTGEEYISTSVGEQIRDHTIVEMEYDPSQAPGWRWRPMRIRHDKTERLMKGILARTLNSAKVAESVWNSIHDPITNSMIRTGAEEPLLAEIEDLRKSRAEAIERKYYQRSAPKEDLLLVSGLRSFHNEFVKGRVLYKNVMRRPGAKVIDFACGKGGDLQKWRFNHASIVFGIDYAGDNIRDQYNGAYARYFDTMKRHGKDNVPLMIFAIGDSSKRIINGDAGETPEERDMMRSMMGRVAPEGPVPKLISLNAASSFKRGADVGVCMFALHYFFRDLDTLNGFLQNLDDCIAVGGYFMGCCFDGQAVFDMLNGVHKGGSRSGIENEKLIWEIRKEYDIDSLEPDETSLGLPIDVQFISIGTEHREYVVNFNYFKQRMDEIGFEVLSGADAAEFKMKTGSEMFSTTYDSALMERKKYDMPAIVKEFSFLNRWFIFKRKSQGQILQEDAVEGPQEDVQVESAVEEQGPQEPQAEQTLEEGLEPPQKTAPLRTVPIDQIPLDRRFELSEIFQIGMNSTQAKKYQLTNPDAAQWLAPTAMFPIKDPDDSTVEYPTIMHFMAGMKYKKATNKPGLAESLMSRTGTIHEEFNRQRLKESAAGTRPITKERDLEILKLELDKVQLKSSPQAISSMSAQYNEGAWLAVKDDMLKEAVKQRWLRDKRFHELVEEARSKGKYILYFTKERSNELAGKRLIDGRIEGDNRYGRAIMSVANF
jgi:hypothetical protein